MTERSSPMTEDEIDASGAPHSGIPRFSPVSATLNEIADYLYAGSCYLSDPAQIEKHAQWVKLLRGHAPCSKVQTYTEVCKNPTCPRGGMPVEIVGSAIEAMRDRNLSRSVSDTSTDRPVFYGAQCSSYPNCTGGCGLGCTHEIEQAAGSSTVCATCNGRGVVGGFVSATSGYQNDPCPDCSQSSPDRDGK